MVDVPPYSVHFLAEAPAYSFAAARLEHHSPPFLIGKVSAQAQCHRGPGKGASAGNCWGPFAGAHACSTQGPTHKGCNERSAGALSDRDNLSEAVMDAKSLLIGALLVGVAAVGDLYWDSAHNTVFKAPGVEIKKN